MEIEEEVRPNIHHLDKPANMQKSDTEEAEDLPFNYSSKHHRGEY